MNGKRLEKVLQALNGRERARLFLQEYKAGTNSEPDASFLTGRELAEYRRLFNIIRFCNDELVDVVLIVREQVVQEELRFNAMQLMVVAAADLWVLGKYVKECLPEPVTVAEATARKKAPKCGFDVHPDDDAGVALLKENRQLALKLTNRGYRLKRPFAVPEALDEPKTGVETVRLIGRIVRDNLVSAWIQLKAVDEMVGRYAEEFGGEDPLRPQCREHLDAALGRCEGLRGELVEYIGEWALPADLADAPAMLDTLAKRVMG